MAPNQRKTDFLQNRGFLAIFWVLKIASKGFVCTLESHKGFVCTVTLRAMCDIALLFDGFAPKPLCNF